MSGRISQRKRRPNLGFTLVEVLTVIAIIGILAALLIPAISGFVRKGKETALKMEIDGLSQAVEQYYNQYGDYPPDFSDWSVVQRHFRKLFPQIANEEMALLSSLCLDSSDTNFDPTAINRAEALVLTLGGYSSDKRRPLSGQGGPFEIVNPANPLVRGNVQYNSDRENRLFEFEISQLTLINNSGVTLSTDEGGAGVVDPIPVYVPPGRTQPYVYFDSRTYGFVAGGVANGYWAGPLNGGVRPYKTSIDPEFPKPLGSNSPYGTPEAAIGAYRFKNPDTFQIISAGLDDLFGGLVFANQGTNPSDLTGLPVYFIAEWGLAMVPLATATNPTGTHFGSVDGFQDGDFSAGFTENGQLDNITNFSSGRLDDDLVEGA